MHHSPQQSPATLALVFALSLWGTHSLALAQNCSKQSPAHTIALLELYTSEGCSSCPPADQFVSGLRAAGLTEDQVLPLSLHVDYWDYIGWKDAYAKPAFTQRQRALADLLGSRTVYTPELFIAGRELRNWSNSLKTNVKRINDRPAQADIRITLAPGATGSLSLEVNAKAAKGGKLFVALAENGLVSRVKAGENQGATLKHDYVVREWMGPIVLNNSTATLARTVTLPAGAVAKNLTVTAFVQSDKGEILQALALPVCGS
ncbi:MAG: DUF1223 domain-containing protein [Pseudomonadota bacterium]